MSIKNTINGRGGLKMGRQKLFLAIKRSNLNSEKLVCNFASLKASTCNSF